MAPIVGGAWKEHVVATVEQSLWLDLLEEDIQSAEISFDAYAAIAPTLGKLTGDELARANGKTMHFAKSFVSAVRRVWWVLENSNTSVFPPDIARAIKDERRKKKNFFAVYIEPRNAVEHASDEIKDAARHLIPDLILLKFQRKTWHPIFARISLRGSALTLASGHSAPVTKSAMAKISSCHANIIASALKHLPRRGNELLLLGPLDTSGWDE